MKTEEFEKKQAETSDKELIEFAEKEVSELARTYGRSHRMSIPPEVTDTDMIFGEMIRRFKKLVVVKEIICDPKPVTVKDFLEMIDKVQEDFNNSPPPK